MQAGTADKTARYASIIHDGVDSPCLLKAHQLLLILIPEI